MRQNSWIEPDDPKARRKKTTWLCVPHQTTRRPSPLQTSAIAYNIQRGKERDQQKTRTWPKKRRSSFIIFIFFFYFYISQALMKWRGYEGLYHDNSHHLALPISRKDRTNRSVTHPNRPRLPRKRFFFFFSFFLFFSKVEQRAHLLAGSEFLHVGTMS